MKRGPTQRGPRIHARTTVDYLAKAREAWGEMPPEIEALAAAAQATSASHVALSVGYSPATLSQVLSNSYRGDVGRVLAKIRGVLMGETLVCPVLGEIATTRCLDEQRRPFAATNSTRARLFHACRRCPNNRKTHEPASGEPL